jgi:hypothetical protein
MTRADAASAVLAVLSWAATGCAPAIPARSPATSTLSAKAPEPKGAAIATSLTRDPLAQSPESDSRPSGHHQHGDHGHD